MLLRSMVRMLLRSMGCRLFQNQQLMTPPASSDDPRQDHRVRRDCTKEKSYCTSAMYSKESVTYSLRHAVPVGADIVQIVEKMSRTKVLSPHRNRQVPTG